MPAVTVLVSRSFTFDPAKQPEMVSELRGLSQRGFTVLGPVLFDGPATVVQEPMKAEVGELTPVVEVAATSATSAEIAAAIGEIKSLAGISDAAVSRLLGVAAPTVWHWRAGTHGISGPRWLGIQSLLRRARKLPSGSTALRDEARGLRLAERRLKGVRQSELTDDQKIEIASLRERGESVRAIARQFGVTTNRVNRIIGLFA